MPVTLKDLLNAPTEIEFEGVAYKLRQPNLTELGEFQAWLEQRHRESAGRSAVDMPDGVHEKLLRWAQRDITAGYFAFGAQGFAEALEGPLGTARLTYLILRTEGYPVTPELVDRMIHEKMKEVAAVVATAEEEDPNVFRTVLALLGLSGLLSSRGGSSPSPTPPSTSPSGTSGDSASANSPPSTPGSSGSTAGSPS
jgi:hypothetical protein